MNSNMVKPEECGYLHLVYHFTVPLKNKAAFLTHDQNKSLIKGQYSLTRIVFYNYFDYFCEKLSFWFHLSSNKFCSKDNMVWPLGKCLCWVFWILLIVKLTFNIVYILLSHLFVLLHSIHSCLPVCQSYFNGWFRSQGKYRAALEFKSSGCAASNNLNYDSNLSFSVSVKLSQNHLTHVLIQPSVIVSNQCVRG